VKSPWLGPLVGLALVSWARAEERKPVPLYTNEDLDRLSPLRGQTGALSGPAVPATDGTPREGPPSRTSRGEDYWRQEAARVRERVHLLEERAEEIRLELREARSAPSPPWSSRPRRASSASPASREARLAAREARLAVIEQQIRELESDLADRARWARALPGWLR
jgi:uncharacterized coiled-coil protein SlyX